MAKVVVWNSAMEMLTSIPADSILGKGDYESALPFYKERRLMLAGHGIDAGSRVRRRI
jgi:hypothetical protein